jgi:hypothetical protein
MQLCHYVSRLSFSCHHCFCAAFGGTKCERTQRSGWNWANKYFRQNLLCFSSQLAASFELALTRVRSTRATFLRANDDQRMMVALYHLAAKTLTPQK